MTNTEICDALFADRPKLQIQAKMHVSRIAKQFKKDNKFPAWKWEEYTHQGSHNRYLITYYAPTLDRADDPSVKYLAFLEEAHQKIVIECGHWPYRRYGTLNIQKIRAISYYCPHFFQRYRERVLNNKKISYNDLLCRYFWRNQVNIPIEMNEKIQRKYKEYGDIGAVSFQQPEGICFIQHWCEGDELSIGSDHEDYLAVVNYLTIVTDSMMSDIQKEAIGEEGKKYMHNYLKRLMDDVLNTPFFRHLINEH